jgi:nicotinate phosphoribosyltransferase
LRHVRTNESLAMLTDLYQLTMAYGHWKLGLQQESVFHLTFRDNPFKGGYSIACGLGYAIEYLENFRFDQSDLAYLGELTGADQKPLFERGFLDYLRDLRFSCDIDAIPEGTVVFPHEPLVRVTGSLFQCQLLETTLLNLINFQTLIATKAARVCHAARGDSVLEFGLRRAQGPDGALAASRASYVGGCAATSNVLAGKKFGIPVKGTHAHSWVMSFDSELESFEQYAEAMPNNCVFLVDTYNTIEGVKHAITVGRSLRERGHDLLGIRLDSGDLAALSIEARELLDAAGFANTAILASNDLDEKIIQSLKEQGARIAVWGVGTRLSTAFDQPALGGVYKLAAVRRPGQPWQPRVKLSEQTIKVSIPGIQQTRRYRRDGEFVGDIIYAVDEPPMPDVAMVDPMDHTRRDFIPVGATFEDLLVPLFRDGRRVYDPPSLAESRERTSQQLAALPAGVKRFLNPHRYPVGLERGLFELRTRLILEARGIKE